MRPDDVRPADIRLLLDQFADVPGTANNLLGALRAVSSWGLERGHFSQSITGSVKPYKSDGGHRPNSSENRYCHLNEINHLGGPASRAACCAKVSDPPASIRSDMARTLDSAELDSAKHVTHF
jgi:hypothetical protein